MKFTTLRAIVVIKMARKGKKKWFKNHKAMQIFGAIVLQIILTPSCCAFFNYKHWKTYGGKKKVFFVHLYLRLQKKFRPHWLDALTWDLEDRTRRNHHLAGRAAFSSLTEHMSLDPQQLSHIQCAALGCLVIVVAARLCILMSRHNSLAVALSWLSVPWATATKMFWNFGVLQNIPEDGRGHNYPNWPDLQWFWSHFRRLSCRALSDPCSVLLFCCLLFFNSLWKQLVFTVLWLTNQMEQKLI